MTDHRPTQGQVSTLLKELGAEHRLLALELLAERQGHAMYQIGSGHLLVKHTDWGLVYMDCTEGYRQASGGRITRGKALALMNEAKS